MNEEIIVLKTCPSMSGRSNLTYQIGSKGEEVCIRLVENSAGGIFHKDWISLAQVEAVLSSAESPFTSTALYDLFRGKSINTAAFILAVLLKEGLIQSTQGKKGNILSSSTEFKKSIENLKVSG